MKTLDEAMAIRQARDDEDIEVMRKNSARFAEILDEAKTNSSVLKACRVFRLMCGEDQFKAVLAGFLAGLEVGLDMNSPDREV